MKHIHTFQHIGGGCSIDQASKDTLSWNRGKYPDIKIPPCDDHYKCECGAEFKAYSLPEVHFQMPQYIAGKDEPETVAL